MSAAPNLIELPTDATPVPLAAEMYAQLGFVVIPLHGVRDGRCTCGLPECEPRSAGKHPVAHAWQKLATSDPDRVRELFRGHRWNIGIMLGRTHVVLDVDGPVGFESLATLGALPDTLTSRSGSGEGEHRVFAYAEHHNPDEVTNRAVAPKLDVKTRTGQIVVAPSLHRAGHRYRWTVPMMPATLPDRVFDLLRRPQRAPVVQLPVRRSGGSIYDRARAYLERIPSAISGSGGHEQTFGAARALVGFMSKGLQRSEAWALLCDYNRRCEPPWSERELEHKLSDAERAHSVPALEDRQLERSNVHPMRPAPKGGGDEPPGPSPEPSYRERMLWEVTAKGAHRPAKHAENGIVILRYHPAWEGRLRFDRHSQTTTVREPPWHDSDKPGAPATVAPPDAPWTDDDSVRLSSWLRREEGLDLSVEACERAVAVASHALPYHPVCDYLEALAWDGRPRLESAPAIYFGAAHTLFTSLVMRWWMTSAVARTFEPGIKADNVLVLEGSQGLAKSTALRVLASDRWFSDTPIDLRDKDAYLALPGRLIVELAELDALKKADVSRIKAFFSSSVDTYRPPYGRRMVSVPRGCVFAGTVNPDAYLTDPTGNRRFWPVRCTAIDIPALRRDRDQLWAEAVHLYRTGFEWWPSEPAHVAACVEAQEQRLESDVWDPIVAQYAATHPTWEPTTADVMRDVLNIPTERMSRADETRVGAILRGLGFRSAQVRAGNIRIRRYKRG